jgi:chromate transport protein ChrA
VVQLSLRLDGRFSRCRRTAKSSPFFNSLTSIFGIFLPRLLLITGVLPLWGALRNEYWVRKSLLGINAAVVGVLIAALQSDLEQQHSFTV